MSSRTNWRSQRIKYLYRVVDNRAGNRRPPLLSVSIHHGVVRRDSMTGDEPRADDLSTYKICARGDIVLNRMRAFQGAIGISLQSGLVSPDYLVLRPSPLVEARFLHHLFRSTWFIGEMISRLRGIGSTSQGNVRTPRINPEGLGDIEVDLPPLDEQCRIADFLDVEISRITRLEDARRRQVSLLRERLASRWSEQVTGLGSAYGWTALRRFIVSITDGPFGSGLTSDHYSSDGARVIRLGNIGQALFRNADKAYIPVAYARQLRHHEVRSGDLLIAGLGDENFPLGRACVAPEGIGPAIVKADCFRVRLDQRRVTHAYAAWVLSSPPVTDQVMLLARGATRARINLNVAREIAIPVPPLRDQSATCGALTHIRNEVGLIEQGCVRQLDLLAERRRALITAAVTGQMDVTTARRVSA